MAITTRQGIFDNQSQGDGLIFPFLAFNAGNATAAAAASGGFNCQIYLNSTATRWGSLAQIPEAVSYSTPTRLTHFSMSATSGLLGNFTLGRFYKCGTIVLTSTGNQWTHDSATFPILKNQMGASSALTMQPIIQVTTVTATTAPAFIIKDSGGGAGYKNQDGNSVVGTKTFTMPANATNTNSAYLLRLEDGDAGVQDITQIDVTVASGGSAAATIWLFEPLAVVGLWSATQAWGVANTAFNPYSLPNLSPGTATTGTATQLLGILSMTNVNTGCQPFGMFRCYQD